MKARKVSSLQLETDDGLRDLVQKLDDEVGDHSDGVRAIESLTFFHRSAPRCGVNCAHCLAQRRSGCSRAPFCCAVLLLVSPLRLPLRALGPHALDDEIGRASCS